MTRITSLFIAFAAVILLAACGGSSDYKKTKSGLLYRITSTGNNPQVKVGEFIKFDYVQKVNDSVLGSSYGKLPAYTRIDSVGDVYDVSEAFRFLHKGDSLETVLIADSIINKNPGQQMAPFIKKGAKLDNLIQVAHNVEVGHNTVIAAQAGVSDSTKIGNNVMIGGQAGLVGHIQIADGSKINAQSGVSKSIKESYSAVTGSPAWDYTSALRSQAVFRNLPQLEKRVQELEELVKQLMAEKVNSL